MSDIVGELARVKGAFEQPTLTLLHQRQAPVIIAIFRSSFARDVRTIVAPRLHDQVEAYLDELRLAGESDVPAGSGRELCLKWMRGQWLVRSLDDNGDELYTLTSHAQDALQQVKSLTRERASLSEHRISTIVAAARRFNADVNPDRAARVGILDADIARLSEQRDQLLAGGDMPAISDEYMLEGYSELLQLVAALPSDFSRVEEAFTGLRAQILAAFRVEGRRAGDVVSDYLTQAETLKTATAEGRAFEGAFALLRDDELLLQLREDVKALMDHPQAPDILTKVDRRELRGIVNLIRSGMDDVIVKRSRVTAALREYIVTHDSTRDRELDSTLSQLETELATWMRTAGPRTSVPVTLLPARADVRHLRERFHDPANEKEPPPLANRGLDRPADLSLHELLMAGGPSLGSLREALEQALAGPDPAQSLGHVFDGLQESLRRPVEIYGLLHLATNQTAVTRHADTERYDTIRPDGSSRGLDVPRITPNPPTTHAHEATVAAQDTDTTATHPRPRAKETR